MDHDGRGAPSRTFAAGSVANILDTGLATNSEAFKCCRCKDSYRVEYHGRRPPWCPQLVFMEDVFCIRDPFAAGAGDSDAGEHVCIYGRLCRGGYTTLN